MLQAIRDKVTGWIAYGIIFLISIPFALWGVNSYLGGGEVLPAATVNGEEISVQTFDRAYANYRQRLAQLFGGSIPESFSSESVLRVQVLDQLVEETALRQYIENQRYRIGDGALGKMIRNMDEFKRDGQFDAEIYQAQLRSVGLSPLAFEQQLRLRGSMEQFQNGIRATAFVTPQARKRFANLKNQTRKIRSLNYRVDAQSLTVSASEIEQYYLANPDRFNTPEKLRIDYIELSLETIKQNIVVSEEDIKARYQEHLATYTSPEFREASHILITTNDEADDAAALAKINAIRDRIIAGENFAELATELSEDPVSAADGGSLGEVGRGDMVPTFESALFALKLGELGEPVKTAFGWHLIQVNTITGGEVQSYDSVKSALADEIKSGLAEVQIFELVERLANIAYEQPDSLLPAAEQLDLKVQTSDWFDRSAGTGIAADPRVRQLAFSDEILEQGMNSDAVELGNNRVLFIRLNERRPAQAQSLEEVQQQVRVELVKQKVGELSLKAGTQALSDLESGEKTLDDLAQEWGTAVADHGFVERNQSDVSPTILRRSFTMSKPEQGLVYDGLTLGGGEYVLIELSAVMSNDAELEQANIDNLLRSKGDAEYQAALNYLGVRAEVVRTPLDQISPDDI
ncbi:MAG TPA: SurA N-terminal domain-containing protein [Gammaproteobacteria bacterium]|nr:SurA N-terminal domain-containing protein [Gammaproteobacteria bacterium]